MTFSEKLRFHLLCGLGSILHLLGFSGLTRLGSTLGRIMWRLVPRRRELATNSIMRHLGKDREEAERIARESFCHTGQAFMEILLTGDFGLDSPRLRTDSPELLERLRRCERPIVAATAHFGSWELLASLLGQIYEAPRPRLVVVRR